MLVRSRSGINGNRSEPSDHELQGRGPRQWRNVYGPLPKCKKNRLRREQSAKMHTALEWRVISGRMMMLRACLSWLIATVVKDLVTSQVFRQVV